MAESRLGKSGWAQLPQSLGATTAYWGCRAHPPDTASTNYMSGTLDRVKRGRRAGNKTTASQSAGQLSQAQGSKEEEGSKSRQGKPLAWA